MKAFLC